MYLFKSHNFLTWQFWILHNTGRNTARNNPLWVSCLLCSLFLMWNIQKKLQTWQLTCTPDSSLCSLRGHVIHKESYRYELSSSEHVSSWVQLYLKNVRRKATRWWWVYCDRQPQHEGGITGATRGRRRRSWRTRREVGEGLQGVDGRGQRRDREGLKHSHYSSWDKHIASATSKPGLKRRCVSMWLQAQFVLIDSQKDTIATPEISEYSPEADWIRSLAVGSELSVKAVFSQTWTF